MLRLNLVLLIFLAAGCGSESSSIGPSQSDLDRVAQILEQPKIEIAPILGTVRRPQIRGFSETRIGFRDALDLGGCRLLPIIAERNSSLGRQKQASVRLVYEWKIASGLAACPQLRDKPWFQDVLLSKQDDVTIAVAHLLFKSQEAKLLNSYLSRPFLKLSVSSVAYKQRFEPVRRLLLQALNHEIPPSARKISEFEEALSKWSNTQHHASLRQAVHESISWLLVANRLQRKTILEGPICPMGTPTLKARRIKSFLSGYFSNAIQPKLSIISRSLRSFVLQWDPVVLDSFPGQTLPLHLLGLSLDAEKQLKTELRRHVKQWQIILEKCQLEPRAMTNS